MMKNQFKFALVATSIMFASMVGHAQQKPDKSGANREPASAKSQPREQPTRESLNSGSDRGIKRVEKEQKEQFGGQERKQPDPKPSPAKKD